MIEYYKFIIETEYNFTKDKIYKALNPNDLEAPFNFINDMKEASGWSGINYKYFTPATEEEWLKQENIKLVKKNIKLDYFYLVKLFKLLNIK